MLLKHNQLELLFLNRLEELVVFNAESLLLSSSIVEQEWLPKPKRRKGQRGSPRDKSGIRLWRTASPHQVMIIEQSPIEQEGISEWNQSLFLPLIHATRTKIRVLLLIPAVSANPTPHFTTRTQPSTHAPGLMASAPLLRADGLRGLLDGPRVRQMPQLHKGQVQALRHRLKR